jgi:hypothetical protein
MAILNLGKFNDCLGSYKRHCDRTLWTKCEMAKFYFANLLSRRIQLNVQSVPTVFEICQRVQEKEFYYKPTDTKICGMQFLTGSGKKKFSEPITQADAELFKDLVFSNCDENGFEKKNISFNALSGWLGTLLPHKFIPVTSNHFRHTISYLFDLELKIYQEKDYDFFIHSQKCFDLTKKKLKEYNLDSLYLKEIAEYIKFIYPKSVKKKEYEEHDWNWITQDFHLYVYREILGMDSIVKTSVTKNIPDESNTDLLLIGFEKSEILNIYVP